MFGYSFLTHPASNFADVCYHMEIISAEDLSTISTGQFGVIGDDVGGVDPIRGVGTIFILAIFLVVVVLFLLLGILPVPGVVDLKSLIF